MSKIEELTKVGIKKIENKLDSSLFTKHAFERNYNVNTKEIVNINFKDNPSFKFIVQKSDSGNQWTVIERPGNYLDTDISTDHADFNRCISNLNSWLSRIEEEVTYQDVENWSQIAYLRNLIEEKVDEMEDPETPYGEDEAQEWKNKINEVIKNVDELRKEKNELSREIQTLKSNLKNLGEKINKMPKRTWLRSVMGSAVKFAEKVALHDSIGKTLVGTAMKALLPDINLPVDDVPKLSDGE